jgi:hypothetical protein
LQDNAILEDAGIKNSTGNRTFHVFFAGLRILGYPISGKKAVWTGYYCRRLCLHDETAWSVSSAAINRSCKAKHDKNAADYLGYSGLWTGGPAQRLNAGQAEEVPLRGDLII